MTLPAQPERAPAGRNETEAERIDRNVGELLQELRVAGLGVQVLFGFLLAMPFTNRFASLDPEQDRLYVAVLLLAALGTALLTAPVAYHRLVFRRHKKHDLLRFANVVALAGLLCVALGDQRRRPARRERRLRRSRCGDHRRNRRRCVLRALVRAPLLGHRDNDY